MPNYKDGKFFNQLPNDGNFDSIHLPGQRAPFSGIYRCTNCGFEAVSTKNNTLPPEQYCHQHSPAWTGSFGSVSWQLVAAAIHIKKNA